MSTLENIRNRLINKILITKNEKFLEAVENLFITTQGEEILKLSNEQIEMLQMSEEDIKYGRIVSESEINNQEEKWLLARKFILTLLMILSFFEINAQTPDWLWAKNADGENQGQSISTDGNGNVYVTGFFSDPTVTFDNITLMNTNGTAGKTDLFIVKYDGSGIVQWAKNFGGNVNSFGMGITSDANGNTYVTGIFNGSTLIFDTIVLTSEFTAEFSLFIAKFDTYGNVEWAKNPKGDGRGVGICATALGNVYLTGVADYIIFDSDTLSGGKVFIVKYDSTGNVLWARNSQNKRWGWGQSVATDINENAFITGSFKTDTAIFGNDTLILGDTTVFHYFVVKYDKLGNEQWASSAGPETFLYAGGKCITSDFMGNVIVTGSFNKDSITFGGYTLTNADSNGFSDIYIVKYDTYGNVLWAKREGGTYVDLGQTVSTNAQGNIFLTARSRSDSIVIGNDTLINNGGNCSSGNCFNIIVVKYDSSGNFIWSIKPGGANDGSVAGSAIDSASNLFITGCYQNDLIFGNTTLVSSGTYVAQIRGRQYVY